jgi:hypothetical protein
MSRKASALKLKPGDRGYVGWGHPPEHGKIKPGEKRNPYGRKGKPREGDEQPDFAAEMAKLLSQPIQSKDGQVYKPTEVLFNGLMKTVSTGDVRAMRLCVELFEKYQVIDTPLDADTSDATDAAILKQFRHETLLDVGIDPNALPEGSEEDDVLDEAAVGEPEYD